MQASPDLMSWRNDYPTRYSLSQQTKTGKNPVAPGEFPNKEFLCQKREKLGGTGMKPTLGIEEQSGKTTVLV